MRSKFSELVAMGIAGFEHTPIAQETPQYCPVCHTYNNVWGVITDTHMSCLPNGRRVITGTFVSKTPEWTRLMYASFWGGVRFDTTGYMSLSEFLYTHGLETVAITLNGQPAIELVPCEDCPVSGIKCTSYTTTETKFPQPVQRLGGVIECLESGSLKEAVNKLNASMKVPGNHWHVHENKIVGQAYGQTVILEVTFDKGIKVENEELHKMLESAGAGDLFFRQYPRHFVLDSTDPQCKLALKNLDENVIFVKKFDDMTVQEWFDNAKCIVASFRQFKEN